MEKTILCRECDAKFSSERDYREHQRAWHTEGGIYYEDWVRERHFRKTVSVSGNQPRRSPGVLA